MENKNLYNKEAKEKIKELAEDIDFAMMATHLDSKPFHAIPMSTKKVDEDGNIWFLSGQDSEHNAFIKKDSNVVLLYSKPSDMSFLTVFGEAVIETNKHILENLYGKSDNMWFDGVDDPNLSAIKFKPKQAQYWEPKHNKLVTLFKFGVGAVTGEQQDLGNSGSLKP